jgi:hypothetical protein
MAKRKKSSARSRRPRRAPSRLQAGAIPERTQPEPAEEWPRQADTSPRLTGGDLDANWKRAASVGEEAVGGSAVTPDQDVVDQLGDALGVPRAPDEEFRTSDEILKGRDRYRWEQEP